MNCRHCQSQLNNVFLDLGSAPPSNAYLEFEDLRRPEISYPLKLFVCTTCWLVQTEDHNEANELFMDDYAYFSSTSKSWLDHAEKYSVMIRQRLSLDANSYVIEVASNDGYLLRNFLAAGIPCLGIEPTLSTAVMAEKIGIPVRKEFFGETMAKRLVNEGKMADLVIGNNVYAHVPDINDFTNGLHAMLKPDGVITLEFPHLMSLIEHRQFDTVYHEHYSYLSLMSVQRIFKKAGLRLFDVEKLPTHGGSLRVYGCREDSRHLTTTSVDNILLEETKRKMNCLEGYDSFQPQANAVKDDFLSFLIEQKRLGKKVVGYGAAAKGNTLLNYAGIRADLIPFICDASPSKQGKYMPGSRISIVSPNEINDVRPDFIVVFPWNLIEEVREQLFFIRQWGGKFVTAVPELTIS